MSGGTAISTSTSLALPTAPGRSIAAVAMSGTGLRPSATSTAPSASATTAFISSQQPAIGADDGGGAGGGGGGGGAPRAARPPWRTLASPNATAFLPAAVPTFSELLEGGGEGGEKLGEGVGGQQGQHVQGEGGGGGGAVSAWRGRIPSTVLPPGEGTTGSSSSVGSGLHNIDSSFPIAQQTSISSHPSLNGMGAMDFAGAENIPMGVGGQYPRLGDGGGGEDMSLGGAEQQLLNFSMQQQQQ